MHVLGLQGSPRKNGNTDYLLQTFLEKARQKGAGTELLQVSKLNIRYCLGCGYCEKHGFCVIKDDEMAGSIYRKLRKADLIVLGSPVFFYGITAQLKALIDRSQTLWSRKHVFKLKDPFSPTRQGMVLSVAASRGKQLFDGVNLTAGYFFDAVDARFGGGLTYRGVEAKGEIKTHETVHDDMDAVLSRLIPGYVQRKKVVFVAPSGDVKGPAAAAFACYYGGHTCVARYIEKPGGQKAEVDIPLLMSGFKIDMAFQQTEALKLCDQKERPDLVVNLGINDDKTLYPGVKRENWHFPGMSAETDGQAKTLFEQIRQKVKQLVKIM